MNWKVTLDFKRGASFGPVDVSAADKSQAIQVAVREAKGYGFEDAVKKAVAVPA